MGYGARWVVFVALGVIAAQGCGSGDGDRACVPGASQSCAGPSDCAGHQVCNDEGSRYEACICGDGGSGGGGGGSGGSSGSGGSGDGGTSAGGVGGTAGGTASANAGGNGGTAASGSSGGSAGPSTTGGASGGAVGSSASTHPSTAMSSTTGAAGAPAGTGELAEPCDSDEDCESGLTCVTAGSNSLITGGPSHGWCTAPCDATTPCASDSVCMGFDGNGFCMPTCNPNDGIHDCAERDDAVCEPVPIGESCSTDDDCAGGTYCYDAVECVLPVCLPKCGADSDCPAGRFCDPKIGECIDEQPEGSALNELCDQEAEPDECLGFCARDADSEPRCFETCAIGSYPACGSASIDHGTADCLLPYAGTDVGDLGLCVGLCDCNSDCTNADMVCVSFESADFDPPEVRGRAGFCAPVSDQIEDDQILECVE